MELDWVIGRRLGPHLGNFVYIPQSIFGFGLEMIFASSYSTHYPIKVYIDLRVGHCYISFYGHHDIAHFDENDVRSVTSGEGLGRRVINFLLQVIDGFIG